MYFPSLEFCVSGGTTDNSQEKMCMNAKMRQQFDKSFSPAAINSQLPHMYSTSSGEHESKMSLWKKRKKNKHTSCTSHTAAAAAIPLHDSRSDKPSVIDGTRHLLRAPHLPRCRPRSPVGRGHGPAGATPGRKNESRGRGYISSLLASSDCKRARAALQGLLWA